MNSPTINHLLRINPRFLRSVNLERDFQDSLALDGYVATLETERHLRRIGNGLRTESGQRAWRITGDFGSGKSSFALVLANLLGRPQKDLPKSIRKLRDNLGIRATLPVLPVLVTGSREPIARAVLRALDTALNKIDKRKKLPSRDAIHNIQSSATFEDRQALDLIEQACRDCVEKRLFSGIVLIIDELGKFLEYSALHPELQDAYFLQSLAELSSRSGPYPLHTLGLLHQGFAEYAERLPTTVQKEWAKIAERFEEISFSQPLGQVTTLLSAALSTKTHHPALRGWKGSASADMRAAVELGMYGPTAPKTALATDAPNLYPIHPTVVPVLSRFFRRFGQNERSLFSFLLSTEPFALQDFATQDADASVVYRLSDFYDFAAFNFAQPLSAQSFRSHWNHIDAIVRSATGETREVQALLKTVGILNILETPELAPTIEVLRLATGQGVELDRRLQDLCQRNILYNRGTAGFALWPHTSVNLEIRAEAAREAVSQSSPIATVIKERLDARPIVARRHYIQTGNLRYFNVQFVDPVELKSIKNELTPQYPADGTVAVVLCETEADRQAAEKIAKTLENEDRILTAISPPLEPLAGSVLELERWLWIERHTPELKDDRFAEEEVQRQIMTSKQVMENRIQDYVGFRGGRSLDVSRRIHWIYKGTDATQEIADSELQIFLSNVCEKVFHKAPRIRNELVNRNSISASAASARQKLFKGMLGNNDKPNFGIPEDKFPPEKSMYLSVLQQSGIHAERNASLGIGLPDEQSGSDPLQVKPALDAVLRRLEEIPDQRVSVKELYDILRSPPYGIKDGLIPILLLTTLITHETEIAVYEDGSFQPEVEENLMMRFAKRPETFEFQLCRITGVRKALISELAVVVNADRAETSQLLSIVKPLYLFVAGLPEYARNTDQLSQETLAFRKVIEEAREPGDLVFNLIPKALGFESGVKEKISATDLSQKLGKSITELRRAFPELQQRMATSILKSFRHEGPLDAWRQSIEGSAETVLVGLGDPDFRAFCLKLIDTENPETEWLEALGSLLTRRPPSRWKDRDETVFQEKIEAFARQFERVLATCFLEDGNLPETAMRVSVTPRNGLEKNLVISLTPQQVAEADQKLIELRKILSATDSNISLAAISKFLWDELKENNESD